MKVAADVAMGGRVSRRQRLMGICDLCGEGPAEAGVGAKQDREIDVSQRLRKVAEWVKSGSVVTW